ncbi:UPF0149 family protein [Hahella sp. HN01]|uniref:UPF0149 family protein n=1 Tax=unclassified Hahella TaxID=2624107 RepID=UPI001C1EAA42|nr:UPF0149 family protein [Hahella sp. HN01]MBU6953165.1 UPF0149 family protein [Hahella sp. HN01]
MSQPYHALQQLLNRIDADATPAGVHGLWCGRMAAGDRAQDNDWWSYTQRFAGSVNAIEENLQAAFKAVYGYAEAALMQDNMSFQPWLPEDAVECSLRVAALADWCRGFVEGLTSVLGSGLSSCSADVQEVLQDLVDIGEVDPEVDGDEQDERELLELTEFVKVAALNVLQELTAAKKNAAPEKKTLH